MITIKKAYIGNASEAFIEKRFSKGMNIIYSNENDKGKTIVMQSIMYVLGNAPIFPGSFPYKDYYHILEIEVDNKPISICRKDHSITVNIDNTMAIYDNLTEFKHFFDKNIAKLPIFLKDNKDQMADLELFIQLFFVGQDNRDSSKIFNAGYYSKDDFINMVYAMADCYTSGANIDIDKIKQNIAALQLERDRLAKTIEISSEVAPEAALINYTKNKETIDNKILSFQQEMEFVTSLRKDRARLFNRKTKNEQLIIELNSLNRNLSEGSLKCLDCNSGHIGYENSERDFTFDVSDTETRRSILNNIRAKIASLEEEIRKIDRQILEKQTSLKLLLTDKDVSLQNLLFYKDNILSADEADQKIIALDTQISNLKNLLNAQENNKEVNVAKQKTLSKAIIEEMNCFYKTINPDGLLVFNSLFTTKDRSHSGSEVGLFYLSKLYALAKNLNHSLPIVVDGFREGEISTLKEDVIIKEFAQLPNQIIFTATLKEQENGKYNNLNNVNKINYSDNKTSHILNKSDLAEFIEKMKEFSLYL